ncbi:MAG: hypothetical protein GX963_10705 [Bacteroidales bacterium]|nr:hypothetical protein [Bacteroidales bacterium]
MKKIILLIVYIILSFNIYSQEKESYRGCDIFLDLDYLDSIPIYNRLNTSIVGFVKHDTINDNYVKFKLLEKNSQAFYVDVYYSLDEDSIIATGWINKSIHLGVFSRAYDRPLILYKEPSEKSAIICIEQYNPKMYVVLDFYNRWLKIKTIIDEKLFCGWIPPEMQCANVYSTCS